MAKTYNRARSATTPPIHQHSDNSSKSPHMPPNTPYKATPALSEFSDLGEAHTSVLSAENLVFPKFSETYANLQGTLFDAPNSHRSLSSKVFQNFFDYVVEKQHTLRKD